MRNLFLSTQAGRIHFRDYRCPPFPFRVLDMGDVELCQNPSPRRNFEGVTLLPSLESDSLCFNSVEHIQLRVTDLWLAGWPHLGALRQDPSQHCRLKVKSNRSALAAFKK